MAGGSESSVCKRCKKVAKNAVKCKNCETLFHISCARLSNVKVIDDATIVCCESALDLECDSEFFDAMEVISGTDKKIDFHIFKYIIKQKDSIISELNAKVNLLNIQIELNNKHQASHLVKECHQKTESLPPKENGKKSAVNDKINKNTFSAVTKKNINQNVNKTKKVTREDLSAGLLQAESEVKLSKYINLAKNDTPPISSSSEDSEDRWQQVPRRKKGRSVIIGSNKDSAVHGVPKYAHLHVYRVDPKISTVELTELLKPHLPETVCEAITPRHPGLYSSYKVSVYESNFKKAMDSSIWPFGACISRFLQMGNRREKMKD